MSTLPAGPASLTSAALRSSTDVRARLRRVRHAALPVAQSAIAAGLAWFLAGLIPGHPVPYFAPIAAVIALGISLGQRTRRAVEIAIGVAVGVLVGDVLVMWLGVGTWQVVLAVALAMAVALFAGGSVLLVNQAAASAILIVVLTPPHQSTLQFNRFIDAVIGGTVAIAVNVLLLPLNPVTLVRRTAVPLVDDLRAQLDRLAAALESGSVDGATGVLKDLRAHDGLLRQFEDAASAGREVAALAPVRWHRRGQLDQVVDASTHLDRLVRNLRVCARRSAVLLRSDPGTAAALGAPLRQLAEGIGVLSAALIAGTDADACRPAALAAAAGAGEAATQDAPLEVAVVAAQIRSMSVDLLRASGVDADTAIAMIQPGYDGADDEDED